MCKVGVIEEIWVFVTGCCCCAQDEMRALRQQVQDIVEENRALHEELRRSVVHEIAGTGLGIAGVCAFCFLFGFWLV